MEIDIVIGWAIFILNLYYILYFMRKNIVHPIAVSFASFVMYFSGKFLYFHYSEYRMGIIRNYDALTHSLSLILLFFALAAAFHFLFTLSVKKIPVVSVTPRINFFALNVFLIGLMLTIAVSQKGIYILKDAQLLRKALESQGMGYFAQLYIISIAVGVIQTRERWGKSALYLFMIINISYSIIIGRPSYTLNIVLSYILAQGLVWNKVPFVILPIAVVTIPLLAVFMLIYRTSVSANTPVLTIMALAWEKMTDNGLGQIFHLIFARSDQLEMFTNLVDALKTEDLDFSPLSPFYVFVQFIPRALWPDKPTNFTTEMTGHFSPRVLEAGAANNYLGLGEMYYAFNVPGIVIAALISGFFLFAISKYTEFSRNNGGVFIVLISIIHMYGVQSIMSGYFNDWALPAALITIAFFLMTCRVQYSWKHVDSANMEREAGADSPPQVADKV